MTAQPRIAVLLPCYNEEVAIGDCVRRFREVLPEATIYVYDNNSKDKTREVAAKAGAVVRGEPMQGKGYVVCRMFADIDADIYVMADGDNTYDPHSARKLIDKLVSENLDMVVGARIEQEHAAYRRGHRLGNFMLTWFLGFLFRHHFKDILSGYRVFSRRFAKTFPALAEGFDIEAELTVHALSMHLPTAELPTPYGARPAGSFSKLNTYRDGVRVLYAIVSLFRDERPLAFFGIFAGLMSILAVAIIIPVIGTFLQTGLVPRQPTVVLSATLMLLAFLSLVCGLVLDTVSQGRREQKRLAYLRYNAPSD